MRLTAEQMIEALRENNEALNRGEFDAAIELAAPDIVYVRPGGLPELQGAEAIRAWMEPDAFESQSVELLSHEAAGHRILTRQITRATGAGSDTRVGSSAPAAARATISLISSRWNQRASASSSGSTVISSVKASVRNPIIRLDGNGHGCAAR